MDLLTSPATDFLRKLHENFDLKRRELLALRAIPENSIANLIEKADSNSFDGDWKVATPPPALVTRTVEITGPAEAKMVINALNSGANVFMADFEDSLSPTWQNILAGHEALQNALRRELAFTNDAGKTYHLNTKESELATLIVRPRGWHLLEPRFKVDGQAMSGSLFDFGLYIFHGGKFGIETGRGPFFYLPKMESALEARLWNDVFNFAELELKLKPRSIRATVLIETLPGALAMENILFELRDYIVGLNAGRWDYLFSMIKSVANTRFELTFPDRGRLTMEVPFMRRYAEKIVAVCERRGAYAMGGMSALIPSRKDAEKNEKALANVKADKEREARQGFRGTWVAHPDLVQIARTAFETTPRDTNRGGEPVSATLLPRASEEPFMSFQPTQNGALVNIDVALRYLAHWLNGQGAVAIHGLMEDAATAEISRAQLWQWRKNAVILDSGVRVTSEWLRTTIHNVSEEIQTKIKEDSLSIAASDLKMAEQLLLELVEQGTFTAFLTLPAMDRLKQNDLAQTPRETKKEGDTRVDSRI